MLTLLPEGGVPGNNDPQSRIVEPDYRPQDGWGLYRATLKYQDVPPLHCTARNRKQAKACAERALNKKGVRIVRVCPGTAQENGALELCTLNCAEHCRRCQTLSQSVPVPTAVGAGYVPDFPH